jgi:hypothetical protein
MTEGTMSSFDRDHAEHIRRIWEEIGDRVSAEPHLMQRDVFLQLVTEHLVEDGTLEDMQPCFYRTFVGKRRMEAAGYGVSEDGTVLDVAIVDLGNRGRTLPSQKVTQRFREASRFLESCKDGLYERLEPASPTYDMAQRIHEIWPKLEKVRTFLFTDGRMTLKRLDPETVGELTVTKEPWDLTRIGRLLAAGVRQEDLDVDLTGFPTPVVCLPAPASPEGYRCLLALVPGRLLADLYEQYGARLLQRNVRAFLQNRNKVNRGINSTVKNEPTRFLAYNNGISATARDVEITIAPDGTRSITRLVEPQIVNGGQTTASLHHAQKRDGADLSDILVAAKITVVDGSQLEDLVPRISRYANSQNVIREADFEANSQFHVSLEELSRRTWAPAAEGASEQHRWYYERVRGQYNVDVSRAGTGSKRSTFKRQNRRFTKTDAAKYEAAWLGKPHIVSLGAEKCFQWWTKEVVTASDLPDSDRFKDLVAKGILFESIRKVLMDRRLGGYLAQTTAYVLSLLVDRLRYSIDLEEIWRTQRLPPELAAAAIDAVEAIRSTLIHPPGSGNVTEWCKKEACWTAVQAVEWTPRA